MTFAEFQDALGDVFIRLNRGCLVSAMAIHNIDNLVNLSNGESLEYTSDHKFDIIEKFRKKRRDIVGGLADNNNPTDDNGYHEHYKCFDNIPIAFTDIEMVFDNYNQAVDWIFRYGNEALARLENCPLDKLIGSSFGSIFENMDTKWLRSYERAVHCGCMLFDISKTKISGDKTAGENAILMYLQKMMNL